MRLGNDTLNRFYNRFISAREQLEWGRKNLSKETFWHFHDKTVEELNKEVEELLGFKYESDV